jgi:MFS family permease
VSESSFTSTPPSSPTPLDPPPQPYTFGIILILVIAVIGFAFDTFVLLMMPLIARPALAELLHVDPNTASGSGQILNWLGYITFGSAVCGGVFGMLGGYLTDWFGRRTVLTYSILLYALAAGAAGFVTSAEWLLVLRCIAFIGVCVEFVAAVAWLAELFPNPRQREAVLGYTQAFSSVGGLLVTGGYLLINHYSESFPPIYGGHSVWRYTLLSGVIPAIPLILIRPFLPESPSWKRKKAEGTLKRPNIGVLFQPAYRRTTLITAALFACGFGAAFGAIQLTPLIVPGLVSDVKTLASLRRAYEAAQKPEVLAKLKEDMDKAPEAEKGPLAAQYQAALKGKESSAELDNLKERVEELQLLNDVKTLGGLRRAYEAAQKPEMLDKLKEEMEKAPEAAKGPLVGQYKAAVKASGSKTDLDNLEERITKLEKKREEVVGGVQLYQEVGGLVGRFALAWLALRIVSRRKLLWMFQVPGLLIIPLVFIFPAAGNLPGSNLEFLKAGIFLAGFLTVAQFSYWGNYLPLVYPTSIRGTGESFAANVGGRMVGTAANPLATRLAPVLASVFVVAPPVGIAYAAAAVAFLVYFVGTILTCWLPEPSKDAGHD